MTFVEFLEAMAIIAINTFLLCLLFFRYCNA
jgi:hypothetical protein